MTVGNACNFQLVKELFPRWLQRRRSRVCTHSGLVGQGPSGPMRRVFAVAKLRIL